MKEQIQQPTNSADHKHAVHQFLRRLTWLLTLKQFLLLATAWCFIWGTAAITLRATLEITPTQLLWGATGVPLAIAAGAWIAQRQLPTQPAIRALLDQQNRFGGLLMTAEEQPLGRWEPEGPIRQPRLRWRGAKTWNRFAFSIAFVGASLLVPVRFGAMNAGRPLDVSKQAETLAAQIRTLKEEQILTAAKAEELSNKLEQLSAEAVGEDPGKTWEALDHLNDSIEKTSQDAAANAAAKQEHLERAEALAEGLMAGADRMDAGLMAEAMRALSSMTQAAMKENQVLTRNLAPATQEAIQNGSFKPQQLNDLSKALSQTRQQLTQQLSKLNQAGLNKRGAINPDSLKARAQAQKPDNSGLSQFLKEHAQKMSVEEAVGQWCEGGRGGVSRGRGDAGMTWTEGTSEKNAKFKEKALPPSSVAGLQDSQLLGLSETAPEVQKGNVAAHGALNSAAAGGGSAYTQTILPRHKGAVKRYFERNQK